MKLVGLIAVVYSLSLANPCFADPIDLDGELQHFACPPAKKVNGEFCVDIGGDLVEVDDDVKEMLEGTFVKAYNNLNSQNCDPEARTMESAVLVQNERKLRERELFIPRRFWLYKYHGGGRCRSCPDDAFDDSDRRALWTHGRGTQEATEDCTCPLHPAHNRAPTEQEFFEEFNKELATYNLNNGETAIIVGPCDSDEVDKDDAPQTASRGHVGAATVVSGMLATISFLFFN